MLGKPPFESREDTSVKYLLKYFDLCLFDFLAKKNELFQTKNVSIPSELQRVSIEPSFFSNSR